VIVRALSNVIEWVPADIPVAWEYSSYLMAACFTFGAAMTLRAGGHIRVTLVWARVSPQVRRWMETVLAAMGVFLLRLSWLVDGLLHLAQLRRRGRRRYPAERSSGFPQFFITFGVVLLMISSWRASSRPPPRTAARGRSACGLATSPNNPRRMASRKC